MRMKDKIGWLFFIWCGGFLTAIGGAAAKIGMWNSGHCGFDIGFGIVMGIVGTLNILDSWEKDHA